MNMMKIPKKIRSLTWLLPLIAACSLISSSCGGGGDEPTPDWVSASQRSLTFTSKGEQITITIESSTSWSMEGPNGRINWLSASVMSGNAGKTNVTFTCMLDSEATFQDEVKITAGTATTSIIVIKPGIVECKAEVSLLPTPPLIMTYGIAFEINLTQNAGRYRWFVYPEEEYNKWRGDNDGLAEEAKSKWYTVQQSENKDTVLCYNQCEPNKSYYLVTFAYTAEGNQRGTIVEYPFTTKPRQNQPTVVVKMNPEATEVAPEHQKEGKDTRMWEWEVTSPSFNTKQYYVWACAGTDKFPSYKDADNCSDEERRGLRMAYLINKRLKENAQEHKTGFNFEQPKEDGRGLFYGIGVQCPATMQLAASDKDKCFEVIVWCEGENGKSGIVLDSIYEVENFIVKMKDAIFEVTPSKLEFSASKESKTFEVKGNDEWNVTVGDETWCSVSKKNGSGTATVNVTVEANPNSQIRETDIKIKGTRSRKEYTVRVEQAGQQQPPQSDYELGIDPYSLSFNSDGGDATLRLTGNDSWTVTDSPSWLTVSPKNGEGDGTINVTATKNTGEARSGRITIKTGHLGDYVVEVKQGQSTPEPEFDKDDFGGDKSLDDEKEVTYTLNVSPTSVSFSAESGSQSVSLSGNDKWTASSSASWCTLSASSGTAPSTLTIKATANTQTSSRQATVTIKGTNSGKSVTIKVSQSGKSVTYTLDASAYSLSFNPEAGSQTVNLTGNDQWTASSGASWCTLSKTSGTAPTTLTIKTTENTQTSSRKTTVTIKGTNSGKTISISVSQEARQQPDDNVFERDDYGSDKKLD